jgi:hypothetical protein
MPTLASWADDSPPWRVRRGRQGHGQLQRGLDAGFGQQLLGLFHVERIDARGVHIAKGAGHVVAADGHAVAVAAPSITALRSMAAAMARRTRIVQRLSALLMARMVLAREPLTST